MAVLNCSQGIAISPLTVFGQKIIVTSPCPRARQAWLQLLRACDPASPRAATRAAAFPAIPPAQHPAALQTGCAPPNPPPWPLAHAALAATTASPAPRDASLNARDPAPGET